MPTVYPAASNGITYNNNIYNFTNISGSPQGTAIVSLFAGQAITGSGTTTAGGHSVGIKGESLDVMSGGSLGYMIGVEGQIDMTQSTGGATVGYDDVVQSFFSGGGNTNANLGNLYFFHASTDANWAGTVTGGTYGFYLPALTAVGTGSYGTQYSFYSAGSSATLYNAGNLQLGGQIAVGTSSYAGAFNAVGAGAMGDAFSNNVAYSPTSPFTQPFLTLYNSDTTTTDSVGIYLKQNTTGSSANCVISMLPTATNGSGSLRFNCRNAGTNQDDMTILPSGNVGIGTTSPLAKLDVGGDYNNTGAGGIMLDAYPVSPDSYSLRINPFAIGGGKIGYQFQTKSSTGGTNVPLTFDNAGNVGIGTTAPLTGGVLSLAGHPAYWQAAVPVVSACGGGTAAASSTDNKGQITGITAATACTLTFGSTMPTAPSCHPTGSVAIVSPSISAISTSAVTFAMSAFTGTLYYICQ